MKLSVFETMNTEIKLEFSILKAADSLLRSIIENLMVS